MPKVGEAWYELSARDQGLVNALKGTDSKIAATGKATEQAFSGKATKSLDDTGKAATRFGGTLAKTTATTSKFGGVMTSVGQGVLAGVGIAGFMGVAAAATAFVGAIGRGISAASDLNETTSKVGVVFGQNAKDVLAWGKQSATAFGMSQNAALGAAATYGNLFVALGITGDQASGMSKKLVELAGDLASFNNVSPEEALQALQSGLVGEVEPLRKFGVNLNEVTLSQKAMSMGLVKTTKGVLPPAIRTQAAYALILEQTKTAQGDFARTASGLANQQRIAAAKVEDSFARMGQALLPIAAQIVPAVADGLSALVGGIADVIAAMQDFVASHKEAFAAVGDVLGLVGQLVAFLIGPMVAGIGFTAKLVGNAFGGIADVVRGVVSTIIGTVRNLIGIAADIPGPWQDAAKSMKSTLDGMQRDVDHWGTATVEHAGKAADDVVPAVTKPLIAGAPAVGAAAQAGITDPITGAATDAKKEATKIVRATPGELAKGLQDGKDAVASGADTLKQAFKDHISPTKEIARLNGDLTGKLMRKGLASNDPIIRAAAEQWKSDIQDRLFVLKNGVGQYGLKTGQNYADALEARRAYLAAKARNYTAAANAAASAQAKRAKTWGSNTGKAYADGLESRWGYLHTAAGNYLQAAAGPMRASSPPKEGPLHLIDRYAMRTADTYAESWESRAPKLKAAIASYLEAGAAGALRVNSTGPRVPAALVSASMGPAASPGPAVMAATQPAQQRPNVTIEAHLNYTATVGTVTPAEIAQAARLLGGGIARELVMRGFIPRPAGGV